MLSIQLYARGKVLGPLWQPIGFALPSVVGGLSCKKVHSGVSTNTVADERDGRILQCDTMTVDGSEPRTRYGVFEEGHGVVNEFVNKFFF